jgi:hypothetical protein
MFLWWQPGFQGQHRDGFLLPRGTCTRFLKIKTKEELISKATRQGKNCFKEVKVVIPFMAIWLLKITSCNGSLALMDIMAVMAICLLWILWL